MESIAPTGDLKQITALRPSGFRLKNIPGRVSIPGHPFD
jgi:hypothetical protein